MLYVQSTRLNNGQRRLVIPIFYKKNIGFFFPRRKGGGEDRKDFFKDGKRGQGEAAIRVKNETP